MTAGPQLVTLTCHPQTPTDAVQRITARVRRLPDARLTIGFVLDADLSRLRIPPTGLPCLKGRLWEHTCFEAFIALDGTPAYHEFNFAPSSEWALYAFQSYREIASVPDETAAPEVNVRRRADQLELDAAVRLHSLSVTHPTAALRLALSAVVEDARGSLSYWALRHPAGKPDFHHTDAFALMVNCTIDTR